jgi:hypothetical protein
MSNTVRNALVFAGVVALAIVMLILACRIARWLFIAAAWLIALVVLGVVLLAQSVALQAPIWSERLGHAMRGRTSLAPTRDCRQLNHVARGSAPYAHE